MAFIKKLSSYISVLYNLWKVETTIQNKELSIIVPLVVQSYLSKKELFVIFFSNQGYYAVNKFSKK